MRRLGQGIAVLLAVLLLLLLGLMLVAQTEWFKQRAASYISEELDREVVFAGPHSIDWSLRPLLRLEDVRMANAAWAEPATMARADAVEVQLDLTELVRGRLWLPLLRLDAPRVHLLRDRDGRENWHFLTDDDPAPQRPQRPGLPDASSAGIGEFIVEDGRINYADAQHRIMLDLLIRSRVHTTGAQVDLGGTGQAVGIPLTLNASAWTPEPEEPLIVTAALASGEHQLDVSGVIEEPMDLRGLNLAVTMTGPDPRTLAASLGQPLPELGDYRLSFLILHAYPHAALDNGDQQALILHDIGGHVGGIRFGGDVRLHLGERFAVAASLVVNQLDLDALEVLAADAADEPVPAAAPKTTDMPSTPLAASLRQALQPLRRFDADLHLWVGELQTYGITAHDVETMISLERGVLEIDPLSARLGGGEINFTGNLAVGEHAVEGTLTGDILHAIHLGQLGQPGDLLQAAQAVVLLPGRLQLRLTDDYLLAGATELHIRDRTRNLAFRLEAATNVEDELPRTHLRLVGFRDDQDFFADFFAGPLLQLTEASTTPPLYAELRTDGAFVAVRGEIQQQLGAHAVDARFNAEGPNLEALGTLLGVDPPMVPPFQVSARLLGVPGNWQLRDLEGQFGDSDLAGTVDLFLEPGQAPRLHADLHSELLAVADLTQEPAQEREAGLADLLGALNGDLRYRAERIRTARIPIDQVLLQAQIDATRIELQPLEFRLGKGALSLRGFLNADQVPMQGQLDANVLGLDLREILPALGIDDDSAGILSGRADIRVQGHTYMDWLYSAVGELRMLITGGEVDTLLMELAGEQAAHDIMQFLLPEGAAILELECAHLAVNANQGLLELENMFLTTPNINVLAEGSINLDRETVNLSLNSETEDLEIVDLLTPIEVRGPWDELDIDVLTADFLARALAALTLGAVLAPGGAAAPGAIAPLLAGLGDDPTPCHEIIEQALADIEQTAD